MICPRCNFEVKNPHGLAKHKSMCNVLPLPDEIAQEIIAGASIRKLTIKYGSSNNTITTRARLSQFSDDIKWRKWKPKATRNGNGKLQKPPRCECGVLLEHPDVPKGEGEMCGYCMAEAREREAKMMT